MALRAPREPRPESVGHVPHEAQVRVDARVKDILTRRDTALRQARRAMATSTSGDSVRGACRTHLRSLRRKRTQPGAISTRHQRIVPRHATTSPFCVSPTPVIPLLRSWLSCP